MISSKAHEEGILSVVWLGSRPSLCPLKTTAGRGGLQVRNHQYWCFQKQHKTCLFWTRRAEARVVVVSSDVLSAYGGGAAWLSASPD